MNILLEHSFQSCFHLLCIYFWLLYYIEGAGHTPRYLSVPLRTYVRLRTMLLSFTFFLTSGEFTFYLHNCYLFSDLSIAYLDMKLQSFIQFLRIIFLLTKLFDWVTVHWEYPLQCITKNKVNSNLIYLTYFCQYSMQVMDNVSWAFHCAHTTAQTYGFLDHCTVVFYFYRTGCAGLLADSAADTADVTLLLCFCTFFLLEHFTTM